MARIYVKKRIFVDHLTFSERQMLKLANVAVAEVKARVSRNRNARDEKSKPLSRWYARIKESIGLKPWRDLTKHGDLLRGFLVRTVTKKGMRAENSTRRGREKARALAKIEPWILYSPRNQRRLHQVAEKILFERPPASLVRTQQLGLTRGGVL